MILTDRVQDKCPALIHECRTYNIFYRTMYDVRPLFRSLIFLIFVEKMFDIDLQSWIYFLAGHPVVLLRY